MKRFLRCLLILPLLSGVCLADAVGDAVAELESLPSSEIKRNGRGEVYGVEDLQPLAGFASLRRLTVVKGHSTKELEIEPAVASFLEQLGLEQLEIGK